VIAQRAFAIAAAALFVLAVGVATFGAEAMSLSEALYLIDQGAVDKLLTWANHAFGPWVWGAVLQPLLVRPAWLLPAAGGVICTGLALSLSNRKSTHRSHRRS
jgi:hypothetical protein